MLRELRNVDVVKSPAEVRAPVSIGGMLDVPHMLASYCVLEAFKPGQKIAGLLGLRYLADHVVVLDYPSRRWLLRWLIEER